jgi:hypothetical protein
MSLADLLRRQARRIAGWAGGGLHPSREALQRFVLGDLSSGETARVLQHLVRGCERCRAVTASLWGLGAPEESRPAGYEKTFERVFAAVRREHEALESNRREAERLAAELEALPAARRDGAVRDDGRYHSRALCELLLRRSRESASDAPRAAALGELAVAVACCVTSRGASASRTDEDLLAGAWGSLAGARLLLPDLARAEEALAAARDHLKRGTDDRLQKARLLEVEASLREAEGRTADAARLRGRVASLYRRAG